MAFFDYLQELAQSLPKGPEKEDCEKVGKRWWTLNGSFAWWLVTCSPLLPYLVKLCMDNDKTPFVESLISLNLGSLKWRQSKS